MEPGGSIRVEEAGFGDKNGLRVKYGGLKEITQGSVLFRTSAKILPASDASSLRPDVGDVVFASCAS